MKNSYGMTLIEIAVVVSIIGILFAISLSFQGWIRKYNIERAIREIHTDILNARYLALSENRIICVGIGSNSITIKGDYDPYPDGDGDCNDAGDRIITQRNTPYELINSLSNSFNFQKDGFTNKNGNIRTKDSSSYINCIDIYFTRISLGAWNGSNCVSK